MPQLIKPGTVKVMSQDGEVQVTIALEITINLNADGLQVSGGGTQNAPIVEKKKLSNEDKTDWMIPDFGASPQVDFGKKE